MHRNGLEGLLTVYYRLWGKIYPKPIISIPLTKSPQ